MGAQMRDVKHQFWPDGTHVRFTEEAREAMRPRRAGDHRLPRPLRTPVGGSAGVFTIDNTDDTLHDVILRENGERWGVYWLIAAHEHTGSCDAWSDMNGSGCTCHVGDDASGSSVQEPERTIGGGPRPPECCGVCPGIEGGGYDCTCPDNPRCPGANHANGGPE